MQLLDNDPFRLENIEDAKKQSLEHKLLASGDLFDMACEVTLSGIRWQHPGISGVAALDVLRSRLALGRRLESQF